jgi:hypothetical protein
VSKLLVDSVLRVGNIFPDAKIVSDTSQGQTCKFIVLVSCGCKEMSQCLCDVEALASTCRKTHIILCCLVGCGCIGPTAIAPVLACYTSNLPRISTGISGTCSLLTSSVGGLVLVPYCDPFTSVAAILDVMVSSFYWLSLGCINTYAVGTVITR